MPWHKCKPVLGIWQTEISALTTALLCKDSMASPLTLPDSCHALAGG